MFHLNRTIHQLRDGKTERCDDRLRRTKNTLQFSMCEREFVCFVFFVRFGFLHDTKIYVCEIVRTYARERQYSRIPKERHYHISDMNEHTSLLRSWACVVPVRCHTDDCPTIAHKNILFLTSHTNVLPMATITLNSIPVCVHVFVCAHSASVQPTGYTINIV